jgi:hypothetical protein
MLAQLHSGSVVLRAVERAIGERTLSIRQAMAATTETKHKDDALIRRDVPISVQSDTCRHQRS